MSEEIKKGLLGIVVEWIKANQSTFDSWIK